MLAVVVDTDIADRTIGFCIAGIFGPDEVMTVSSAGRHRLWLEKDSSEDSYQDISEASRLSAASSRTKRKSFIGAPLKTWAQQEALKHK